MKKIYKQVIFVFLIVVVLVVVAFWDFLFGSFNPIAGIYFFLLFTLPLILVRNLYRGSTDIVRQILKILIFVLIFTSGVYLYKKLQPFLYDFSYSLGMIVEDNDKTADNLSKEFGKLVSKHPIGFANSVAVRHKSGVAWEIIQPASLSEDWYVNFIDAQGKRHERILKFDSFWGDRMYYFEPYLFLRSHPGFLHIYNPVTGKSKTFDARVLGCKSDGDYLVNVAYQAGTLYTEQFKEWSRCTGYYRREFRLDF